MLFNSWVFIIFFLITFAVYLSVRRTRFRMVWLVAASYTFYGWLNPLYLILIGYSTIVNYYLGLHIGKSGRKKNFLVIAVINNVLLLGFFKYGAFVTENLNVILHLINPSLTISEPGYLFPVGLSFYTFIATGYIIDVYRGTTPAEKNFVRFAAFLSFFPYLLAGPIERAGNMLSQLSAAPKITRENLSEGFSLFIVGLFKKIALADFLALYVNRVYGEPADYQSLALLTATYAFAWQIYFDFSGYTDMARGVARMFGINLMLNFNNPYLATSLGEFWSRWHISLSSWFRDYLYIPLGGNRKGRFNTYRNMILTMLVAGLWHGASWTFIIWGALHAVGRSITRELERTTFYRERIPDIFKQLLVFHIVCLAWIFFRAETLGQAVTIVKGIFSFTPGDPHVPLMAVFFCASVWIYQYIFESRFKRILELQFVKIFLMLTLLLYMIFFGTSGYEPFIYFQF